MQPRTARPAADLFPSTSRGSLEVRRQRRPGAAWPIRAAQVAAGLALVAFFCGCSDDSTFDAAADSGGEDAADTGGDGAGGADGTGDRDATDDARADAIEDDAIDGDGGDTGAADVSDTPESSDVGPDVTPVAIPYEAFCENLHDIHCALPWPTDRWLEPEPERVTGYRVLYDSDAFPTNATGAVIDATPYERMDGYSPSSQLVTAWPKPADVDEFGGPERVESSLEPDFPTVVVDLETGERIPHWIENDARAQEDDAILFYIRPATRLRPDRAYGVAIRGLRDVDGELFEAPAGFAALRDGLATEHPAFEARRAGFEPLWSALDELDVPRGELQLAWWFHTESFDSSHRDMLHMRDDALERLEDTEPACEIVDVTEDVHGLTRHFTVEIDTPWYLTANAAPAELRRGDDGLPVTEGREPVTAHLIVPHNLYEADADPGKIIIWGHGLFGNAGGVAGNRQLAELLDRTGLVMAGTDWAGMSSSDLPFLAVALADVSRFYMLGEVLQQAMINQITLTRGIMGPCAQLDELLTGGRTVVDPEDPRYLGVSQGAILGGTFLTLSPDIERGALIVGGTGWGFMIERSIHYRRFEPLLEPFYPRRLESGLLMAMSQHVWDRAESASWLRYTGDGPDGPAGLEARQFLYLVAENDAQVPNLASGRAARLAGIPALSQSSFVPWNVPVVDSPYEGSVFISLDMGDRATPEGNLSPEVDDGGHSQAAITPEGASMIIEFLDTGRVTVPCDGICDLSESD